MLSHYRRRDHHPAPRRLPDNVGVVPRAYDLRTIGSAAATGNAATTSAKIDAPASVMERLDRFQRGGQSRRSSEASSLPFIAGETITLQELIAILYVLKSGANRRYRRLDQCRGGLRPEHLCKVQFSGTCPLSVPQSFSNSSSARRVIAANTVVVHSPVRDVL